MTASADNRRGKVNSDVFYTHVYDPPANAWDEIVPRLAVGDSRASGGSFDVTIECCSLSGGRDGALRRWFADTSVAPQQDKVERAISAATDAWAGGQRVLVVCSAGQNRSALVVAAVLARHAGLPVADAIGLLRQQRHESLLNNENFVDWLVADERSRRRESQPYRTMRHDPGGTVTIDQLEEALAEACPGGVLETDAHGQLVYFTGKRATAEGDAVHYDG